jgi:hypothetical protein
MAARRFLVADSLSYLSGTMLQPRRRLDKRVSKYCNTVGHLSETTTLSQNLLVAIYHGLAIPSHHLSLRNSV